MLSIYCVFPCWFPHIAILCHRLGSWPLLVISECELGRVVAPITLLDGAHPGRIVRSDLQAGQPALMVEPPSAVAAIVPALRRQEKALLEQIEFGTAKHLALQHLEAVDMAFDRAVTPGQGNPGFDGLIVIAQPLRKPLQGPEGTLCRPRTSRTKSWAKAMAAATCGCCACSWASWAASSPSSCSGRRSTSQVARRAVRWRAAGSATAGKGCRGRRCRGFWPCAWRRRWA